jgi:DNA polymerase III sliding clamp (beta) subunit (PCNA family)
LKISIDTFKANRIFKKAKLTCNTSLKGTADAEFNFFKEDGLLHIQTINDYCQQIINTEIQLEEDFETFSCEANLTSDFVAIYPGSTLNMVYSPDNAVVHLGDKATKCVVLANDGSDFISLNFLPKPTNFTIKSKLLWQALNHTAFSASKDSMINAVSLSFSSSYLTAYSFDDRRISRYKVKVGNEEADYETFFIPKETADILIGLLEDCDIEFQAGQRHMMVTWGKTKLVMSLVQIDKKSYPNLNGFFEIDDEATFTVNKNEFKETIRLSGLLVKNSFINIQLKNNELIFTASDKDRGTLQNKMAVKSSSGDGIVQVLYKDLTEVINKIDGEELEFSLKIIAEGKPGLCISEGNFKHILLPIVAKENEEDESES